MVTLAVIRTTWFSPRPEVEFVFFILQREDRSLLILEEKNTDRHYRVEYDNHYRRVEDVVKEIVEELRTREFDNHTEHVHDGPIDWTHYYRIIREITDLIDHGVTSFELQGNPAKYVAETRKHESPPQTVVISMANEIEAEFQQVLNNRNRL